MGGVQIMLLLFLLFLLGFFFYIFLWVERRFWLHAVRSYCSKICDEQEIESSVKRVLQGAATWFTDNILGGVGKGGGILGEVTWFTNNILGEMGKSVVVENNLGLKGKDVVWIRGMKALVDGIKQRRIDPENVCIMFCGATWHPKQSSYGLSCKFMEGGAEVYAHVVEQKGAFGLTPFWERHIVDGDYLFEPHAIYEAESRAALTGIETFVRKIQHHSNPKSLIIMMDNVGAVADLNRCLHGCVGGDFFSKPSCKLSHLQAKFVRDFFGLEIVAFWGDSIIIKPSRLHNVA